MLISLPPIHLFPFRLTVASWISEAFAAVLFLGAYSLLISNIFGHRTFWRWQQLDETAPVILKKIPVHRKLARTPSKKRVFDFLDENSILEALFFLSATDLLSISQLSRRHYNLLQQKHVWINLSRYYFNYGPMFCAEDIISKRMFFTYLKNCPYQIIKDRIGINVIINNCVYDLTEFVSHHPGGEAIINEWNGKDATKAFNLALHSKIAMKSSLKYRIWPINPSTIITRK